MKKITNALIRHKVNEEKDVKDMRDLIYANTLGANAYIFRDKDDAAYFMYQGREIGAISYLKDFRTFYELTLYNDNDTTYITPIIPEYNKNNVPGYLRALELPVDSMNISKP